MPLLAEPSSAFQSTLRPLPVVARSWAIHAEPASSAARSGAARDLEFIGPLPAQEAVLRDADAEEPAASDLFVEADVYGIAIGGADLEGGGGDLTTVRGGWRATVGVDVPDRGSYAFGVQTEGSFYDFGGSPLGLPDPFNDVYETNFSGRFLMRQGERIEWYGGAQIGLAGEDNASVGDAVVVGSALAVRVKADERFSLLAGLAGVSRFEDSPWILPYVGFDWQITERLRLLVEAAEIHADLELTDDLTIGALAVYDFRQYRLNDNGPLNGGAFRDEEIRAGGRLDWRVGDDVSLELEAGQILWRETSYFDGDAGFLGESEPSSSPYLQLGFSMSF